jgi:phospholipid/cholesterol/gamma-HCH transport system substrate-binding protein
VVSAADRPTDRGEQTAEDEGPSRLRRALTVGGLIAAAVLLYLVLTSGDTYEVKAEFENASQLVTGNEVVVGGAKVGKVEEIELGSDGAALVTFSVDEEFVPLHRGTVATIRTPALSTIAGRQIQLTLPPSDTGAQEIPDGGALSRGETVSAVDLDQLFNTLDPETIEDFKHVIQGFELSYEGVAQKANRGYRYLNPFLSTSRRVFGELSADQRAFENLIVDTSKLSGALASRSGDLEALIANLNSMMNAIGDRKESLAAAVSLLPGFMRAANTTFVNLRSALDDLDPLVAASKPAATELRPFLSELRGAAADAVPTIRGLDQIVKHPGGANDLVELTALQPRLAKLGVGSGSPECGPGSEEPAALASAADDDYRQGAFGESVCALQNSLGNLSFFRSYTPEVVGWFHTFKEVGLDDATGTYARIALGLSIFSPSVPFIPNVSSLLSPEETLAALNTGDVARCPGRNERDPGDGSVPFTDASALTDGLAANGECDLNDGAQGP